MNTMKVPFRSVLEWLEHEKRFHRQNNYLLAITIAEKGLKLLGVVSDELREAADLVANDEAASYWIKLADEIDELLDKEKVSHVD